MSAALGGLTGYHTLLRPGLRTCPCTFRVGQGSITRSLQGDLCVKHIVPCPLCIVATLSPSDDVSCPAKDGHSSCFLLAG